MCGTSIVETGGTVGIRCIISKFIEYHSSFMSVHFCFKCVNNNIKLEADHRMVNMILDEMDRAAGELNEILASVVDMSARQFFHCVMLRMRTRHRNLMRSFGMLIGTCTRCQKKEAKAVCGGCNFYSYCNAYCCKQDWPNHKHECKWLKEMSIFMLPDHHVIVTEMEKQLESRTCIEWAQMALANAKSLQK
jgi:hypothetical protein